MYRSMEEGKHSSSNKLVWTACGKSKTAHQYQFDLGSETNHHSLKNPMNGARCLHYVYKTYIVVEFMKIFITQSAQAHNKLVNPHHSHEIETITRRFPHQWEVY